MSDINDCVLASVDITGSDRNWDLVWVGNDKDVRHASFRGEDAGNELVSWASEIKPDILAIDAPSGKNFGQTLDDDVRARHGWVDEWTTRGRGDNRIRVEKYSGMRVCEALLCSKSVNLYFTPRDAADADTWIQQGWKLYDQLEDELGYQRLLYDGPVDQSKRKLLIEVHPHASFVVGIGHVPHKKQTLAGIVERVSHLVKTTKSLGLEWQGLWPGQHLLDSWSRWLTGIRSGGEEFTDRELFRHCMDLPLGTHDVLDCFAGLLTARCCIEGLAHAVGEHAEGVIVLPSELADDSYQTVSSLERQMRNEASQ